jgi:calcium-translocating P-type ATPase
MAPTTFEEAIKEIELLKGQKRSLESELAKFKGLEANGKGAGQKLNAAVPNSTTKPGFIAKDDGTTKVDRDQLCTLVTKVFENSKAVDAKANVLNDPLISKVPGGPSDVSILMEKLCVVKDQGLDQDQVKPRELKFGRNEIPMEPQKSLFTLMLQALDDQTLLFLCFAAVISLGIGIFVEKDPMGWLEGTAILTAVLVVVLVGSINDYQKESQFRALNAKKDDMNVTVIRNGADKVISCHDVVVGDIMKLSTGDIITADAYAIGANDLQISEKALTGETDLMKKGEYVFDQDKVKQIPILYAGTMVQDGQGKVLVLAVGTGSYQGKMQQKIKDADEEHTKSILETKLDKMTAQITKVGAAAAMVTMLVLALRMYSAFQQTLCCKEKWDHAVHWSEVLGFLISGVTIFVVAVPEGLPLAVTIALAFSVSKMLRDQNLVRHLSACETMGGATTICSDKTGTLTTSRMTVTKVYVGGKTHDIANVASVGLQDSVKDLLMKASVINTMSKTNLKGPGDKGKKSDPVYQGNDTECGLLVMANLLHSSGKEIDYNSDDQIYKAIRKEFPDNAEGYKQFSFSSDRKRMCTRVKLSM